MTIPEYPLSNALTPLVFSGVTAGEVYEALRYKHEMTLTPNGGELGKKLLRVGSGEFVEVLNFREDNEESSEETTGCKASVYAEFDECTRSENFIEILRFRQFARYMSFTPTGKQGKKKQIMNGIEVSVVLHLV